jgi:ankyrin repeat protein
MLRLHVATAAVFLSQLWLLPSFGQGARNTGATPLMKAAHSGDADLVAELLDLAMDVELDEQNSMGDTALMLASGEGHASVVALLLAVGAALDKQDNEGGDALYLACRYGRADVIHLLAAHGADANAFTHTGFPMIYVAVWNGHTEAVRALLESGAAPDSPNPDGLTPLMAAALTTLGKHYAADIIVTLLAFGADPAVTNDAKWTALMGAAKVGNTAAVAALLSTADGMQVASMQNDRGQTALMLAARHGRTDATRALLGQYAHSDQYELAVSELSQLLDVQSRRDGRTALMVSALHGHEGPARVLVDAGANVAIRIPAGKAMAGKCGTSDSNASYATHTHKSPNQVQWHHVVCSVWCSQE